MDIYLRNMTSLYLYRDEEILCLYRIGSRVANNKYVGSAGGHFEKDELNDPKKCVIREMKEELGLLESDVDDLRLRYVTYRLAAGEIRQNYYYFARLKKERELVSTEGILRWIPYGEVDTLEMPVSAKHMIMHYCSVGRYDDTLYAGVTQNHGTAFVPMEEF